MSLSTPGENFEFLILTFKVKILNRRVLARVWVSVWVCGGPGVRVHGCVGGLGVFFPFILVRRSPYQSHGASRDSHWSPHAMIRSLRSRVARCKGCWGVHFRNGRILRLGDRRADGVVRRPGRSVIRVRRGTNAAEESEESCLLVFVFGWTFSFFSRYSHHVRRRDAPQRFCPGDIVLQRGVDDFFLAPTFACEGLEVMCASDELKCSVMLLDASMGPIFGHFQRPRARHCHLQCSDTQLDPIFVCGLSQSINSSSLLFVLS